MRLAYLAHSIINRRHRRCADARCDEQYRLVHAGVWKSGWSGGLFSFSGQSDPFTVLCESTSHKASASAVQPPPPEATAAAASEQATKAHATASDYMHSVLVPLLVQLASTKTTEMYSPQPQHPLMPSPNAAKLPTTSPGEVVLGCLAVVAMFVPAWLRWLHVTRARRGSPATG